MTESRKTRSMCEKEWGRSLVICRESYRVCLLVLIRRGGVISCKVTGGHRYSGDLHSGKANLSDQADRSWA